VSSLGRPFLVWFIIFAVDWKAESSLVTIQDRRGGVALAQTTRLSQPNPLSDNRQFGLPVTQEADHNQGIPARMGSEFYCRHSRPGWPLITLAEFTPRSPASMVRLPRMRLSLFRPIRTGKVLWTPRCR